MILVEIFSRTGIFDYLAVKVSHHSDEWYKDRPHILDVQTGTWSCLDVIIFTLLILWCCISIHSKFTLYLYNIMCIS